MARLSQADLAELNRTFDDRSPQELLLWARDIFGDRIAALTSMQEAGNVVCHMLHSVPVPMPVVFVDTGVLFQETLDTRDRLAQEYGLTIRTLTPALTMQQQTEQLGILYLTPEGQKQCCELRKNEPLDTVRGQYDAMIGSLRRADGGRRGSPDPRGRHSPESAANQCPRKFRRRTDGCVYPHPQCHPESAP